MYGYRCEYCDGIVQPRLIEREAFKHKNGFVILENVTIGVRDACGNWMVTRAGLVPLPPHTRVVRFSGPASSVGAANAMKMAL